MTPSTTWKFYFGPSQAWEAMLEACRKATVSIDLEQFIFQTDSVGKMFLDVCIKKAREGVKVRIIADAVGSYKLFISTIPQALKEAGVEIVFFNSFIIGTPGHYSTWYFRDHRKLLVVDKTSGFTGGICLDEEMKDWRDTHVQIQGPVVEEMSYDFEAMWQRAWKVKNRIQPRNRELDNFSYVSHSPLPKKRYLYYSLIEAIRNAKKYIYLTTPYFLPDHRLLRVLRLAARRGVDVRILVPQKSDHAIVSFASQTYFHECLKSGLKIYIYRDMLHAKAGVIDDQWATVGSLNLDNVSLRYNFEANLVSHNSHFAKDVRKHFIEDMTNASELTLKVWNQRPLTTQLLELFIWPFRKLL